MIDLRTVNQIKNASIEERINIIEFILQSLKNDLSLNNQKATKTKFKPFKIRKFSLGQEVHVDRDELYAERGF